MPKVYWDYSGSRMLTLKYLEGVQSPTSTWRRRSLLAPAGLAYRATETWMEMIFRHGFFRSDPHPASVLVSRAAGSATSTSASAS